MGMLHALPGSAPRAKQSVVLASNLAGHPHEMFHGKYSVGNIGVNNLRLVALQDTCRTITSNFRLPS
jgi:hypothetical protein